MLAGLLLLVILGRGQVDRGALLPGSILGLLLFGGYVFQTWGLIYTTPSKSAFLTGFSVILVPVIMMFSGFRMGPATLGGGVLGLLGIYLLVAPSGMAAVNRGDMLTLAGALSFAIHIVLVGHYTKKFSFLHLVPVQILAVGLLSLGALPFVPNQTLHLTGRLDRGNPGNGGARNWGGLLDSELGPTIHPSGSHGADLRTGAGICCNFVLACDWGTPWRQGAVGLRADSGRHGGFGGLGRTAAVRRWKGNRALRRGLSFRAQRGI